MTQKTPNYGFYGRLRAEFPSQVIVDATEHCNLACTHCPHPSFKKSEHYSGSRLDPALNAKMVDEVSNAGNGITQYIRYTANGEPLLHPNIFEMLQYSASNSATKVCLTTNGTLLTEERVAALLDTNIYLIDVSIDAYSPETYAKIRVRGDLEVTNSGTMRLLQAKQRAQSATKIIVSYVEQKENRDETEQFETFWKEQGVDYVVVRRLHSASGAKEDTASELHQIGQETERRPCLYPWERISLNARGHLSFCPSDWLHGSEMCDYRDTTIQEVWSNSFYRKLREAHLSNNFDGYSFCEQCPDWQLTRWPGAGRSYADMVEEFDHEAD